MSGGRGDFAGERAGARWEEVDRLLRATLGRPPAEREPFLRKACPDDPATRRRVRALIEGAEGSDGFLTPAREAFQSLFSRALENAAAPGGGLDSELGPYRLCRVLGRGGMSTVYLAERTDGTFQRRVAIKVLRYAAGKEMERRFRAERQILAGFQHPNIAQLLDGGTTADGRPYLVLEYVEGRTITSFCREEALSLRARLRLFLFVCRAVQHANSQLVVHRDLKPSNVLVTAGGQVKLLDFGIAKLLAEIPSGGDAVRTRTGHYLLTPEYGSPEQFLGNAITATSDVYQLGVLLYELVTGRRPHRRGDGGGASLAQLERAICQEAPVAPGKATDARIPGDLERIILKALRKEPERRYSSADALASDLERFLDGLPVHARGDQWGYRLRKFFVRHRWPAAVGAVGVAGLLAFGLLERRSAERVALERDRARMAAERAEAARDFTMGLFSLADPDQNRVEEITARELLDAGAERVRRDLAETPRLRGEMLAALASIHMTYGDYERALPLAREALSVRREALPAEHPDRANSRLQVARIVAILGREGTTDLLLEALAAVRRAHGPRALETAEAFHAVAFRGEKLPSRRREALEDSAVAILEALGPEAYGSLARVLTESVRYRHREWPVDSARLWRALEIQRELDGDGGAGVAAILGDIALRIERVDRDRAVSFARRALEMHRAARGPRHPVTLTMTNNLAALYRDRAAPGDLATAETLYRRLLVARREADLSPVALAYTLYGLGRVLVKQGEGAAAAPYLEEIVRLGVFPAEDGRHALVRIVLGRARLQEGRYAEAEASLRAAEAGSRGRPDLIRQRLEALESLYERWGRPDARRRVRGELAAMAGDPGRPRR